MINGTGLSGVSARKELEIKSFLLELLMAGKALALGVQFHEDVVVAGQDAVDSPNHIDLLVRFFVVVAVAALVAAELLVHAPDDGFAAIEAFPFFFFHILVYLLSGYHRTALSLNGVNSTPCV